MSAIAGLIRLDGTAPDRATLQRMQAVLAPYGVDAQRQWREGPAGLLHCLLRITPEDSLDQQPRLDPERRCVVLFDGRLDNRRELAAELGLGSAELALLADVDLVQRACLRWADAAPEHLLGSFAYACWWPAQRRLELVRDAMGGRPLVWFQGHGFFAFASLPKGLFCIPGVPREICQASLAERLALLPMSGGQTLFKDIRSVERGQLLSLQGERLERRQYYRLDPRRELRLGSDDEYLEAFSEILERSVASCLRAAGPLATQLSSGFDSGTVTALAARQLARSGQRLTAFTAVPREGFDGPAPKGQHADEGPGARAVAARFANIEHVLIRANQRAPLDVLRARTEAMDCMPMYAVNCLWLDAIEADAQRRGVRVLLNANVGNMTISHTGLTYLAELFGKGRWRDWWRELTACRRRHPLARLLRLSVEPHLPLPLWRLQARLSDTQLHLEKRSALHSRWRQGTHLEARAKALDWFLERPRWKDSRQMRAAVLSRGNAAETAIAANLRGLELRDPTADRRLVEFCLSIPEDQYLRDGQTRWLLRRLVGDLLPPEVLNAQSRGYQAADWYETLGAALPDLHEEVQRLMSHAGAAEMLDLQGMRASLENWPAAGWERKAVTEEYRARLMRGLAVGGFIRYVEPDNR